MERQITYLEGFGDLGQGDGFQAADGTIAPGAQAMTACCMFRLESYDLTDTLLANNKFLCGHLSAGDGWGFSLQVAPGTLTATVGANNFRYIFGDGDKPVAGHVIVAHLASQPDGGGGIDLDLYVQGSHIGRVGGAAPAFAGAGLMSIGANGIVPAGMQPLGSSDDIPSGGNGIAAVGYTERTLSAAEIAEHYRLVLQAEDIVDGDLGWDNIWSARIGMPDLEEAGGVDAVWVDNGGTAALGRTQFNDQTPSMVVSTHPARVY